MTTVGMGATWRSSGERAAPLCRAPGLRSALSTSSTCGLSRAALADAEAGAAPSSRIKMARSAEGVALPSRGEAAAAACRHSTARGRISARPEQAPQQHKNQDIQQAPTTTPQHLGFNTRVCVIRFADMRSHFHHASTHHEKCRLREAAEGEPGTTVASSGAAACMMAARLPASASSRCVLPESPASFPARMAGPVGVRQRPD